MSLDLMAQYRAALAAMDWQFEHTDEHRRWANGTNALARLHRMQREVDPTGEVWLSHPGAQTPLAPKPQILETV